jgi:hypothetical protein
MPGAVLRHKVASTNGEIVIPKMASHTVCLGCAQIIPSSDAENFSCSFCGFGHSGPVQRKLLHYASSAAHYGYLYRGLYEDEFEEHGEIPAYDIAPVSDALTWMALAALSGIIGGASWELAGAAVRRIFKQVDREKPDSLQVRALQDQEKLKKFLLYIQDFVEGLQTADPRIRSAILTEMIITEEVRLNREERAGAGPEEREARAIERVKNTLSDRPTEEDFRDAWKNIDLSG